MFAFCDNFATNPILCTELERPYCTVENAVISSPKNLKYLGPVDENKRYCTIKDAVVLNPKNLKYLGSLVKIEWMVANLIAAKSQVSAGNEVFLGYFDVFWPSWVTFVVRNPFSGIE